MIPLVLAATSDAQEPFVARLVRSANAAGADDLLLIACEGGRLLFTGENGLVEIEAPDGLTLMGDVVMIDPQAGRAHRWLRAGSDHNTLLVTERCDQLCVMCSQPPKKTHVDHFALMERACLLAEPDTVIGLSGGEPTLYKEQLLGLLERVLEARPDLAFHVLTNAQHFEDSDVERLRQPDLRRVTWGVPLYSTDPEQHDEIVGKAGAHRRLVQSFARLMLAGSVVELRTVVLATNIAGLPEIASFITRHLNFIASWSIMQLENAGFARRRWAMLRYDHSTSFAPIAQAIDVASLHGIDVRLFNFPRCTVPESVRDLAPASISDWKRHFADDCGSCAEQSLCTGFFAWHPKEEMNAMASPL